MLAMAALASGAGRALAQGSAIELEMWTRATARRIARGAEPHGAIAAGHDLPAWVRELATLDALARAGRMAAQGIAAERPDERAELAAARLRIVPANTHDFEERLARGLHSPFRAVRAAALDRVALWTLENSAIEGAAARFLAAELEVGDHVSGVASDLLELAMRAGGGRRLGVLLTRPVALQELDAADRSGWDPALGFLEDVLAAPLTEGEVAALRSMGTDPGVLGCLELVARVRDGLASMDPSVGDIARTIRDGASARDGAGGAPDSGELDAAIEAFVDALVIQGRHLHDGDVLALGLGLVDSVRAAAESEREANSAGHDRCIRAAARLLPMVRQLDLGLEYSEGDALELWFALDRAERWRGGPLLVRALGHWLDHPATRVRHAVVRALGQRYAYGGRDDFEPLLREVLRDPDPTLRSLSFAWLVKSERRLAADDSLGPVLRAAWDAEGHGGMGPRWTERQVRWLAQFPRERTAHDYRDALLDLLSLSGASTEVMGAGSLELLGGFLGDAEVFARVSLLAERSLVGLEAAGDYGAREPFDSAAARALRILQRVDPGASVALIDSALRRSMHHMHGVDARPGARPQLPKTAAGLLGSTPAGRRRLALYLQGSVPRRVRFEAALQLLMGGDAPGEPLDAGVFESSARWLIADYAGVDGALRLRALDALGQERVAAVPSVGPFLMELVGAGKGQAERAAAIDTLGRRRDLRSVGAVIDAAIEAAGPDAGTIDAAAFAARALRYSAGGSAAEGALALGLAKLRRLDETRATGTSLETVRGALLESAAALLVASAGRVEVDLRVRDEVLGLMLDGPIRSEDAAARTGFSRGRRIEAQFLWSSELAALKVLGSDRELFRGAVGTESRWGRFDGRLLLALARVAVEARAPGLAAELARAAGIALQGEGAARDHDRRLAEARWLYATLALQGSPDAKADGVPALRAFLGEYRMGDLGRGVLRAMLPSIPHPVAAAHGLYWRACATDAVRERAESRAKAWGRMESRPGV